MSLRSNTKVYGAKLTGLNTK